MKISIRPNCIFLFIIAVVLNACTSHEEKYEAYLFAYFIGNGPGEEAVHYALSEDGLNFRALNNYLPILDNRVISKRGGVRDPHIVRGHDGKTFYMVLTDLYVPDDGWENEGLILLKSQDLIQWSHSQVHIPTRFPEKFANVNRVWAPQTYYDSEVGKYMIYWSMRSENEADIIYYAYANDAFDEIETEPRQLFFHPEGKPCIDGDIVFHDNQFHLFFKTEGHGDGIKKAISAHLTEGYVMKDEYLQQTKEAVEGSGIFKKIDSDQFILMYDIYKKGSYQFLESQDLQNFRVIDEQVKMDFHPRHGSILLITNAEKDKLIRTFGYADTFQSNNPVIQGYYADPEIIYSQKEQKFYLYPTSDGYLNWSGTYFKAFSSVNLTDWIDEGIILDLKTQVEWADKHAWAPATLEYEESDGSYKYFYFFTAGQKIGVASANSPTGPFEDSGKPLIDFKPKGVSNGQEIDPDIFQDPVTGKFFLYWGNGYLAVVPIVFPFSKIDKSLISVITPDDSFREGVEVFYRNDRYYFMWSENDTRSQDYRVRYAMADSPEGPLEIPENNLILKKVPGLGIYGTGHNSVVNIPGKDEWYIVYHRFQRPNGIRMGREAGFHREVCIDKLQFDEDGYIIPTLPSLEGIETIKLE
jgi:hypothetical protein